MTISSAGLIGNWGRWIPSPLTGSLPFGRPSLARCATSMGWGHFDACPLPRHPLRNGHLNQMAYSLFLFMRDVADDDFVGWIDRQLGAVDPQSPDRLPALREAIIGPLRNVYGVGDKVLAMALSSLLLGAGKRRPLWVEVGATFVAVDTLVHNFLHRTGILRAEMAYNTSIGYVRPKVSERLRRSAGDRGLARKARHARVR